MANLNRGALPLSVFRNRDYAFVWTSTTLVSMGTQMEAAVLGWYVLTETDSPFLVGSISAARMSLNLMALFAGAIIDRLPRHQLLAGVEMGLASLGAVMLVLILSGQLEVWHIFVIVMVAGLVRVFQMPSAQALVADTLPHDRIGTGAAFITVGMNFAMLIGPLVGGVLFKAYGAQGAYSMIGALYFLSGLSALMINARRSTMSHERESVLRSVIGGLKHVKGEQVLWGTLLLAVIIESSGWTVHTSLMPIFARDVLESDSTGLGLLLFAFGIGALTGSIGLALVRDLKHVGKLMITAVILWHSSILVFATSDSLYLSMGILVFTGMGFASTQVFLLTALLMNTGPEFRGRVMSLRSMAIYAFAMGSLSSGAMAGVWGAPRAASIVGIMGIALVIILALFTPKLRRL